MAVEKALISIAVDIAGSILNKVRDCATNKLRDGDLTNEELRQTLVRELKEINTKLDSLSLKDLNASRSFLKEGLSILILALGQPREDQEIHERPDEATAISTESASGSLNAVLTLPQAIQKLQISSKKQFEEAKKSFQKAREDATRAFNNKSLSIKDRIMACKIRVAARIFESGLEDTETAVITCLLALEELHSLPAIQDMFKVFLNGGMRSWRNKAERLDNIMSVLFINHALFHFVAKCSSKYPNAFTWPRIELADRTFHPILHGNEIVKKKTIGEELGQQLNRMVIDKRISDVADPDVRARASARAYASAYARAYARAFADADAYAHTYTRAHADAYAHVLIYGDAYAGARGWYFAVNSRGEIILLDEDRITVIYSSGESKDVMFSNLPESNVVAQEPRAVAVDSDDNVYVLSYLEIRDENGIKETFVLCVLDENYNIKHDSTLLDFLNPRGNGDVGIALDKNKNTIFTKRWGNQVLVCDSTGELRFEFEPTNLIGITNKNEIMVRSDDDKAVHVYGMERNLKSTIKVPEGHNVLQMAFHHGICKIVVATIEKGGSCSLLCYSETGELEHSLRDIPPCRGIASHPCGTFAILRDKSVVLI